MSIGSYGNALGNQAKSQAYDGPHPGDPIKTDGVRSMIEQAGQAFEMLQRELYRLGELLEPVRLSVPMNATQDTNPAQYEPHCVAALRELVERIERQASDVRSMADELRI